MANEFPSDEWTLALCQAINNSDAYASAAKSWEGDIKFVVNGEGAVYLDLWHGRCRQAKYVQDPASLFVLVWILQHGIAAVKYRLRLATALIRDHPAGLLKPDLICVPLSRARKTRFLRPVAIGHITTPVLKNITRLNKAHRHWQPQVPCCRADHDVL